MPRRETSHSSQHQTAIETRMPGGMQIFHRTAAILPVRTGAFDDQAAQSVPGSRGHVIHMQAQAVTPVENDSPATSDAAVPPSSTATPSPAVGSTASEVSCTSPQLRALSAHAALWVQCQAAGPSAFASRRR